ncbi:FadR/GntR family transcriptional regulator [Paracandidimonas soli]|uniref:FadR/GntR family transcriptional regulator n=1 Tax=Paracandidimonas soli TaxID=1917182 RepID=UPI00333E61EF
MTGISLSDRVYAQLRNLIETSGMQAGDRLPGENGLARQYGVSRPVVRQALAQLRAEGWIHARKGAGNFVAKPPVLDGVTFGPLHSIPDIQAFLDFRCVMEGESAARAARCSDPDLLRNISNKRRRLEAVMARGEAAVEEDIEFHGAIALASGNRFFVMTMSALQEQTRFAIHLIRELSSQPPFMRAHNIRQEHIRIDEAIARGDAEGARLAMHEHLRGGMARLFGRSMMSDAVPASVDPR